MKPKATIGQVLLYMVCAAVLFFAVLFLIGAPLVGDWTMALFALGMGLPPAWWILRFHTRPTTPTAPVVSATTWQPPIATGPDPYLNNPFATAASATPKRKGHYGRVWGVAIALMLAGLIIPSPEGAKVSTASTTSTKPTTSSATKTSTTSSTTRTSSSTRPTSSTSRTTSSAAPTTSAEPTTQEPTPDPATARAFHSCEDARAAGATPLHRGDEGYSPELDRDGDGVACEDPDPGINPAPANNLEPVQQAGVPDNQIHGFFQAPAPAPEPEPEPVPAPAPIRVSSCKEARALGIAPMYQGSPGYSAALDRDHDGVACE